MKKLFSPTVVAMLAVSFVAIFMAGCSSTRVASAEQIEKSKQLYLDLANNDFRIELNTHQPYIDMLPFTSNYYLEVKGDSVHSQMPYFGRVFGQSTKDSSGGEQLFFDSAMYDYKLGLDERNAEVALFFNAVTPSDNYAFQIKAWNDMTCEVNIIPTRKSSITYMGKISLLK